MPLKLGGEEVASHATFHRLHSCEELQLGDGQGGPESRGHGLPPKALVILWE